VAANDERNKIKWRKNYSVILAEITDSEGNVT
jgi:hypothetical protein